MKRNETSSTNNPYITLILYKYWQVLTSYFCCWKNSQQEVLCKDTKACLEHVSLRHSNKVGWPVWMPAALASAKLHEWTRQPRQHKEDVLCSRQSSSFDSEMIYIYIFQGGETKKQRWTRNCWKHKRCPNHWYFIIVYKYNSQTNPELWIFLHTPPDYTVRMLRKGLLKYLPRAAMATPQQPMENDWPTDQESAMNSFLLQGQA